MVVVKVDLSQDRILQRLGVKGARVPERVVVRIHLLSEDADRNGMLAFTHRILIIKENNYGQISEERPVC